MQKRQLTIITYIGVLLMSILIPIGSSGEEIKQVKTHQERMTSIKVIDIKDKFQRFTYNSGFHFEYPEAVRGIYVTGNSAGGSRFDTLLDLIENSDLNSMVIDVKEDFGNLTFKPEEGSKFDDIALNFISDPKNMMEVLEGKGIYPIARIVVFKDTVLAKERPDLSFQENGKVWVNNKEEAFVNPFEMEVWDYNIEIAKMAAEMGFQEIQFDYVRFPEGFEHRDEKLEYTLGDYGDSDLDNSQRRVEAVTNFIEYAREELSYYDVDVAVDVFGYAATITETPGIGQNFSKISENVDVISSMIYPSHWTPYFDIDFPDKEPHRLVTEYSKVENEVLNNLEDPPTSRPWLQDFEAPWLYSPLGEPTFHYGKAEVEAQIKALNENGINEYLLWNAGNVYTENVDYIP